MASRFGLIIVQAILQESSPGDKLSRYKIAVIKQE